MKAMNYDKELFGPNKSMTGHNLFTSEETNGGVLFSRQKYNDIPPWVVNGSVVGRPQILKKSKVVQLIKTILMGKDLNLK